MKQLKNPTIRLMGWVFLIAGNSWLYTPSLNHKLNPGNSYLLDYQQAGTQYGWVFAGLNICAAMLVLYAAISLKKQIQNRFGNLFLYLTYSTAAIVIISALLPISFSNFQNWLGLLGLILFLSVAILAYLKDKSMYWAPLLQVLGLGLGLSLSSTNSRGRIIGDVIYQMSIVYLFYRSIFLSSPSRTRNKNVRKIVAALVAFNAIFLLLGNFIGSFMTRTFDTIVFANDTEWLTTHSILTGVALLLLARQIYHGRRYAKNIVVGILLVEIIKQSVFIRNPVLLTIYGTTLVYISEQGACFDKTRLDFKPRLRLKVLLPGVLVIFMISFVYTVGFQNYRPKTWKNSAISTTSVLKNIFLLEKDYAGYNKRSARLFGQSQYVLGIAFYAWLVLSLFVPSKLDHEDEEDSKASGSDMRAMLEQESINSEDIFKLWPKDKKYWKSPNGSIVAYGQSDSVIIALAEPIGTRSKAAFARKQFTDYCTNNGYKLGWLLVSEKCKPSYENIGLRTITIGSSAVVDIETFCSTTVREKWWRWAMNKNLKAGLSYHYAIAPHDPGVMAQLKLISTEWLTQDGREERGFLLGYFDQSFLNNCNIHCLKDESGAIVAFANQMPSPRMLDTTTIDLMRSYTDQNGSISYLLANAILQAKDNGYKKFDLGFVPLASENPSKVQVTIQKALKPFFSAHGLTQFKNKFDPKWETNYLAYSGDALDLPIIIRALNNLMKKIN
jgi:phosphatidylglycerol lysyltransferase